MERGKANQIKFDNEKESMGEIFCELRELQLLIAQWFPTDHPDGTKFGPTPEELEEIRNLARKVAPEFFEQDEG